MVACRGLIFFTHRDNLPLFFRQRWREEFYGHQPLAQRHFRVVFVDAVRLSHVNLKQIK